VTDDGYSCEIVRSGVLVYHYQQPVARILVVIAAFVIGALDLMLHLHTRKLTTNIKDTIAPLPIPNCGITRHVEQ